MPENREPPATVAAAATVEGPTSKKDFKLATGQSRALEGSGGGLGGHARWSRNATTDGNDWMAVLCHVPVVVGSLNTIHDERNLVQPLGLFILLTESVCHPPFDGSTAPLPQVGCFRIISAATKQDRHIGLSTACGPGEHLQFCRKRSGSTPVLRIGLNPLPAMRNPFPSPQPVDDVQVLHMEDKVGGGPEGFGWNLEGPRRSPRR
ncbi:hypothetical protein P170DRAFT_421562 [Aspergillus steynii IBT 23096]|uniref:Uncharacterized protein n=1 Tax=Aspergillus steynii IBT 23096 TaxID=1392250 RepID=A0A2I2GPX6_9EURO|nr:uncharacterized protein P170DRAFT_421562 [Aspergillus steynii IBT 23096]PLB54927.1 hypothetical protein P170DRAFT_421562 [Aspergillus steynii IBT 23096]